MLDKNTIDAYHKITAPDGLRERIEAGVREAQAGRRAKRRFTRKLCIPAVTAVAAAAVWLAVLAGKPGMNAENSEPGMTRMGELSKLSDVSEFSGLPEMQLTLENGQLIGDSRTELDVYPAADTGGLYSESPREKMQTGTTGAECVPEAVSGYSVANEQKEATEDSAETFTDLAMGVTEAVVFRVTVSAPVTFRTDSDILSIYLTDEMSWTDPGSELVLETDGELRVLLPAMGDGETFYIEMSSETSKSRLEIAYDGASGRYLAGCQAAAEES